VSSRGHPLSRANELWDVIAHTARGIFWQMLGMAAAAALPAGPTFGRSAKIRDELQNSAFKIWKFSDRNLEK